MQPPVHLKQPTPEEFRERFLHYLRYSCGIELRHARAADHLAALELAVRESLIDRAILTRRTYDEVRPKTVHYISVEYLLGILTSDAAQVLYRTLAPEARQHSFPQIKIHSLRHLPIPDPRLGRNKATVARIERAVKRIERRAEAGKPVDRQIGNLNTLVWGLYRLPAGKAT